MKESKDEESSVDSDSEEKDGPENEKAIENECRRTKVTLLTAFLGALIFAVPSIFSMLFTILFSKLDEEQLLPLTTVVPGLMLTGALAGAATGNYLTKGRVYNAVVGAGSYLRHCSKSKPSDSAEVDESVHTKSRNCFKF
ncbi:MAG: hypothetical protein HYX61_00140 [Gammaproteobacteria bacterium]|jgi:hypothetical protein|nr:hypothetical protein [Gammaproteobacteria bacterium]